MTPIIFHQTQTREQKLTQLAQEVTKAGSLFAFFSKLSSAEPQDDRSRGAGSPPSLARQRLRHHR